MYDSDADHQPYKIGAPPCAPPDFKNQVVLALGCMGMIHDALLEEVMLMWRSVCCGSNYFPARVVFEAWRAAVFPEAEAHFRIREAFKYEDRFIVDIGEVTMQHFYMHPGRKKAKTGNRGSNQGARQSGGRALRDQGAKTI